MFVVQILNGQKQDNTAVLQLGQYIMIVTNPWWLMTLLLAVRINRWKAIVMYCVCVCASVWLWLFSSMEKSILTKLSFSLPPSLSANIWLFSNSWPETLTFLFDACFAAMKVEEQTNKPVHSQCCIAANNSQPLQLECIDSNKENSSVHCCVYYLTSVWPAAVRLQDVLMWHLAPGQDRLCA